MAKRNILVFCAHSDDEAVGLGGTILKCIHEGYEVTKVVFSAGEKSHPHYQEGIITKKRFDETEKTSRKFKIKKTIYFGLEDRKLSHNISKNIMNHTRLIIEELKPQKIFLPCEKDPHIDHQAVYKSVIEVIKAMNYKGDVYSYEVWNFVKEMKPSTYVDITPYFSRKIRMMKSFRSQWYFMYPLIPPAYFRALSYGRKIGVKYAERLYKVR